MESQWTCEGGVWSHSGHVSVCGGWVESQWTCEGGVWSHSGHVRVGWVESQWTCEGWDGWSHSGHVRGVCGVTVDM